jgi:hypothetical protein
MCIVPRIVETFAMAPQEALKEHGDISIARRAMKLSQISLKV